MSGPAPPRQSSASLKPHPERVRTDDPPLDGGGEDAIPEVADRRDRIPQGALLSSLEGTYYLTDAIGALDERLVDVSEDDVRLAIDPQG
jgi:hypothetical protein